MWQILHRKTSILCEPLKFLTFYITSLKYLIYFLIIRRKEISNLPQNILCICWN